MISTLIVSTIAVFTALPPVYQAPPVIAADGSIEEDSVLVRYDLGPVLPSFDSNSGWTHTLNRGFDHIWGDNRETPSAGEIYENSAPEAVTELVKQILGDELYAEGRMVSLEGDGSLLVLAPAGIQKRVSEAIEALAKGFSSSVGLQIDVVDFRGALDADLPSSVAAAQVDRLLQGLQSRDGTRHTYRLDLCAGRTGIIDQRTNHGLVVDYDVEIAKGAVTSDPTIFQVEEGEMIMLQAVPFAEGSAVSVVMTSSQMVGDVKQVELNLPSYVGKEDGGRMALMRNTELLQVGQVQLRSVASSAFLGKGQALVYASQVSHAGTEMSRVVVVRQTGSTGSGLERVDFSGGDLSLMLVNAALFDSSPLSFEIEEEHIHNQSWTPKLSATVDTNHSAFLFEWAERHFSVWRRVGPWVAIVTKPEWDGSAAADLERLIQMAKPVQNQAGVSLEFGRVSGGHSPMRWSFPMIEGSLSAVLLGTSSTSIVDLDVEVASNATTKDVVVAPTFHGVATALGVFGTGAGRSLALRGSGTWRDLPMAQFDLGQAQGVKFDQSRARSMIFDHRGKLGPGQTMRLGGEGQGTAGEAGLYLDVRMD